MPIDAELEDEISLRYQMMLMDDVRVALERAGGVKIMILDACRNNPVVDRLKRKMVGVNRNVDTVRGLARIDKTEGIVVAYATAADEVAAEHEVAEALEKLKDEEDGVCFEAHLSRVVVGVGKYGKEASTLIVDEVVEVNASSAKEAPSKRIPESRRLLIDVVALALDERGADIWPFGMAAPKVRAVADSHIRERYFARIAEKAAPDEDEERLYQRQFKAFNRSLKTAIDAKTLIAGDHKGERWIWQL